MSFMKLFLLLTGNKVKEYYEPNQVSRNLINQVVTDLYAGNTIINDNIRYEAYDNLVIVSPKRIESSDSLSLTIFYRPNSSSNLVIESPHEGKDGLHLVSSEFLMELDFKFMICNYVHPYNTPKIGTQHSKSDIAHNKNNLMSVIHKRLNSESKYVFVQVHGMVGTDKFQVLMVPYSKKATAAKLLAKSFQNYFVTSDLETFSITTDLDFPNVYKNPGKGHGSNVQGRLVQKPEGNFIHLELGSKIRKSSRKIKQLIESLNDMEKEWSKFIGY